VADQPVKSFTSPEYQALIEVIIAARQGACVGQEELSKRLGQSRMYIYKCETLRRRVDPVEVMDIAQALGLPPGELFSRWVKALQK
jgi:transcriptional regulator with XRE-family HTH domain